MKTLFTLFLSLFLFLSLAFGASAQTLAETQDCSSPPTMTCSMAMFINIDTDTEGVEAIMTQEILFADPSQAWLVSTPLGAQAFLEGLNGSDPTFFVTTGDVSNTIADEVTINQATPQFQVQAYVGTSTIGGSLSDATLVILTANDTVYTFVFIDVEPSEVVEHVSRVLNGGDFNEVPEGYMDGSVFL